MSSYCLLLAPPSTEESPSAGPWSPESRQKAVGWKLAAKTDVMVAEMHIFLAGNGLVL